MRNDKRMQLVLPRELFDRMQAAAKKRNASMSDLTRQAMEEWLSRHETDYAIGVTMQQAQDVIDRLTRLIHENAK